MLRRAVVVTIAMLLLGSAALADDSSGSGSAGGNPSPGIGDPATPATTAGTPDAAAGPTSPTPPEPVADHRLVSALGVAGMYAALSAGFYYAWYYNKPTLPSWRFGGDGWFGDKTYAGGLDKFGHFWANLTFSRLTTDLLRRGGWGKLSSSLIGSGLTLTLFFFVEVKDGFYYEFSPSDMAGNTAGALLAVAMSNWPALDDALDVRVQWDPSVQYRRHPTADFVEDYSGETFMFAFKPRSIKAVRDSDGPLHWLQFVDPVIAFDTRNYKPTPAPSDMATRRQEVFVGLTIDVQAIFDETLGHSSSRAGRVAHNVGHTFFEFVNPPYTTLPVLEYSHSPDMADSFGF